MIFSKRAIVIPALIVTAILSCAMAYSDDNGTAPNNLLVNGDLTSGKGVFPSGWKSWGFECFARFKWMHDLNGPTEMAVTNLAGTEVGIEQSIKLRPGWYYLSAELSTSEVSGDGAGGQLCIRPAKQDAFLGTDPTRGNTPWRKVGFYFRSLADGGEVIVICRFGQVGKENAGTLHVRNFSLVPAQRPRPGAPQYDLERVTAIDLAPFAQVIEAQRRLLYRPRGSYWSVILVCGLICAVIALGWRWSLTLDNRGRAIDEAVER